MQLAQVSTLLLMYILLVFEGAEIGEWSLEGAGKGLFAYKSTHNRPINSQSGLRGLP